MLGSEWTISQVCFQRPRVSKKVRKHTELNLAGVEGWGRGWSGETEKRERRKRGKQAKGGEKQG